MPEPLPPKGRFRVVRESRSQKTVDRLDAHPFPVKTWPVDEWQPPAEDDLQQATERMYWRDGPRARSLAYRAEGRFPIVELPHLISETEMFGRTMNP